MKLAYTLLNKLGTKNEQILKPGDRVRRHTHTSIEEIHTHTGKVIQYRGIQLEVLRGKKITQTALSTGFASIKTHFHLYNLTRS